MQRLILLALLLCPGSVLQAADWPTSLLNPPVPQGLGVNIHFTDPKPGEMSMLAAGGFRWVRMDLGWAGTERQKGQYDFSAYRRLLASLTPHKIRALLILDYSNRHYDGGLSPHSPEGRKAFARWAAAAVREFRDRGVLWEMYNEPNIQFWKPRPKVEDYIALALEVGKAIRQVAPEEQYIGPATSQIDLPFLEACFRAGLLEYWTAVSVHPYRQTAPETVVDEYRQLRWLLGRYAPKGKTIPILSGEWGYSDAWRNFDADRQGRYLPRQWLINLSQNIPVSIWYDWHDDGTNPKDPEHHFGTVAHPLVPDRTPVYDPKPAWLAAKTLCEVLEGFRFNKRLITDRSDEFVLLFQKRDEVRVAAWTTGKSPRAAVLPASPGRFQVRNHLGQASSLVASGQGLSVELSDAPRYFIPEEPNDVLRVAAGWQTAPLEIAMEAPAEIGHALLLPNPLSRPLNVHSNGGRATAVRPRGICQIPAYASLLRSSEPVAVEWTVVLDGQRLRQQSSAYATNPLRLSITPPGKAGLGFFVHNLAADTLQGRLRLTSPGQDLFLRTDMPLAMTAPQREALVTFGLRRPLAGPFTLEGALEDLQGRMQARLPRARYQLADDFNRYDARQLAEAYSVVPDGDRKVNSRQSVDRKLAGGELATLQAAAMKIDYEFSAGWKFVRVVPQGNELRRIDGRPKAAIFWVNSDGGGCQFRLRFADATGQVFQPGGERLTKKGWQSVTVPLQDNRAGHWGGANDGVVHYPIRWDSLLLVDNVSRAPLTGTLEVLSPLLEYDPE